MCYASKTQRRSDLRSDFFGDPQKEKNECKFDQLDVSTKPAFHYFSWSCNRRLAAK